MPVETPLSTPVRALGRVETAGYRLLHDVESDYRDGGEERVLELIRAAHNVHSTSDELIVSATTWAERYHLSPSRANVLRALNLPADARVLEIGAGCGAITRYLGESCAVVDALEPVPARAAAAAARTRDLDGVQVIVGMLADVPAEPVYDVIVVVGVLEYVGDGTADRSPYREFLDQIFARLAPAGTLVLAIENRLGVKYLVGAPEDHTGRYFDSVEGYPVGGKARTFTRSELEGLIADAGMTPSTLIAFPDYKMTRAVMSQMPSGAESLLYRIPRLPSPDWTKKRPRLADEARVWRSLVEGGLAADFGNSFLVLAGKDAPSQLWPDERLAVFYSANRRPALSTETVVQVDERDIRFERRSLTEGRNQIGPLRFVGSNERYVRGRDLLEVLAEEGLAAARSPIEGWLELLREQSSSREHVPMDLVPHNLVVDDSGGLHVIDIELFDESLQVDDVIGRGIFWLAERVTRMAPPQRWQPHRTVGEVMAALGEMAGLPADLSWFDRVVQVETQVAMLVRPGPPTGTNLREWGAQLESEFRKIADRSLSGLATGERLWDTHRRTTADARRQRERLENELTHTLRDLEKVKRDLARSKRQVAQLRSRTLKGRLRSRLNALLPVGTSRRGLALAIYRRVR